MSAQEQGTKKEGLDTLSTWISGTSSHVGIEVPDLDEAHRFYCGILGFEEVFRLDFEGPVLEEASKIKGAKESFIQIMVPGGIRIELQKYEPQGTLEESSVANQGLNHLSFGVKDIGAEYERLTSLGVTCRTEPIPLDFGPGHPLTGFSFLYFDDPWGLTLELLGPTPGREHEANDDERPSS
jgi:catechol 2,3-dioxygenase-like lactoylglutathione lyase family enzyme